MTARPVADIAEADRGVSTIVCANGTLARTTNPDLAVAMVRTVLEEPHG